MNGKSLPLVAPLYPAGREPLPPGMSEEDREQLMQAKKYQSWMMMGMESCAAKTAMAGVGGTSKHQSLYKQCPRLRARHVTP